MDAVLLARLQFALTIMFHYLFPPLTIGLGVLLVVHGGDVPQDPRPPLRGDGEVLDEDLRGQLRHGRGDRHRDGVPVRHQLGDLLALRRRRLRLGPGGRGDLRVLPRVGLPGGAGVRLGPGLAADALLRDAAWSRSARSSPRSGSSSPTPGSRRRPASTSSGGGSAARAEITDFWAMVFNPSSMDRLVHVLLGAFILGAFFVMSISACYLLKGRHLEFARRSFTIALVVAAAGRRSPRSSPATRRRARSPPPSRPSWRRSRGCTRRARRHAA